MAEMKMEGIEYDKRMEELEKLEYPKPNREFIYSTFNAFADRHPWVGQENIRPKSIAREMFESFRSFSDYIRDYELQRAEGVLLRHLNSVFKVLAQTVPDTAKNDEVREMELYLGTMIRQVDSSLLDEWEKMRDPNYQRAEAKGSASARRRRGRARHHPRHQSFHRGDPQPRLHFPARFGDRGFRGGTGGIIFARASYTSPGNRSRTAKSGAPTEHPSDRCGWPALDCGALEKGIRNLLFLITSTFASIRTPGMRVTLTSFPPKTKKPGACSKCSWTRMSTTTGSRNSRWIWASRGSWANRH